MMKKIFAIIFALSFCGLGINTKETTNQQIMAGYEALHDKYEKINGEVYSFKVDRYGNVFGVIVKYKNEDNNYNFDIYDGCDTNFNKVYSYENVESYYSILADAYLIDNYNL